MGAEEYHSLASVVLFYYFMHLYSTRISLAMSCGSNKVPQCLQKLTSFQNIITGPHVLGCNSGGFLKDVLF